MKEINNIWQFFENLNEYVYATDIGAPEINVQSLKVDKKQVKIGDSVNLWMK